MGVVTVSFSIRRPHSFSVLYFVPRPHPLVSEAMEPEIERLHTYLPTSRNPLAATPLRSMLNHPQQENYISPTLFPTHFLPSPARMRSECVRVCVCACTYVCPSVCPPFFSVTDQVGGMDGKLVEMLNIAGERERPNLGYARDSGCITCRQGQQIYLSPLHVYCTLAER